jgi:hypothetical protein
LLASAIDGCEDAAGASSTTAATGVAARLRFVFLVLIGLVRTDFTDSFAVSALAAVALAVGAALKVWGQVPLNC